MCFLVLTWTIFEHPLFVSCLSVGMGPRPEMHTQGMVKQVIDGTLKLMFVAKYLYIKPTGFFAIEQVCLI